LMIFDANLAFPSESLKIRFHLFLIIFSQVVSSFF